MKSLVALGSNLGDRNHYLHQGRELLAGLGHVVASPLTLETPDESGRGPAYLNTVICLQSLETDPRRLLESLLRMEYQLGRDRSLGKNQPRTLDLDLLATDQGPLHATWTSPADLQHCGVTLTLDLPHPKAGQRSFVLEPLAALIHHYPEAGVIKILA